MIDPCTPPKVETLCMDAVREQRKLAALFFLLAFLGLFSTSIVNRFSSRQS